MNKKVVGILRGGTWENYDKSLFEGGKIISHVYENLSDKWKPVDILIDKDGVWHLGGLPIKPADLMNKVNVVWNTVHPSCSVTLSSLAIPNVETNSFSKSIGSKEMLREHMKKIGIKMPRAFVIPAYQEDIDGEIEDFATKKAKEVFNKFSSPWIVRSLTEDLNAGIHLAKTFPELVNAILDCVHHNKSILVEEFIFGKTASVHSVTGFRGENFYNFPPVEHRDDVVVCPGKFSIEEKEKIIQAVKKIYSHTNTPHYLKSNFVVHPSRGIYFTHLEFFPDLDNDSDFHISCESVGTKMHHVLEHILERAI